MIGILPFILAAILVYYGYMFAITYKFGWLPSISESHYRLVEINPIYSALFTLFLWIEAFLLIMPLITIGDPDYLGFLTATAVAFCGSAPFFKSYLLEKRVHVGGAISAVVFGLIWSVLNTPLIPLIIIIAILDGICVFIGWKTKTMWSCKTFWFEQLGFGTILFAMLYNCLHLA